MAVVVTVAKGYDLGYIWKTQGEAAGRTTGGYYINAAQAGEPPGRWWGPGAQVPSAQPGQPVSRMSAPCPTAVCGWSATLTLPRPPGRLAAREAERDRTVTVKEVKTGLPPDTRVSRSSRLK